MTPEQLTRQRGRRVRGEAGSGTLLVLGMALLLLGAAFAATIWALASSANHRAATAADLSALSAAGSRQRGEPEPCRTAARIASRHGATLESCAIEGETVQVVVTVRLRPAVLGAPSARASARAGPTGGN